MKVKKFYIETYGCQMNVADSEVVAAILEDKGYQRTQEKSVNLQESKNYKVVTIVTALYFSFYFSNINTKRLLV